MIVIDQEKIIEIAADLLGGRHAGVDVKFTPFREGREGVGQHGGLDVRRQLQLVLDPLAFGLLAVPGLQRLHLPANILAHQQSDQYRRRKPHEDVEPSLFVESLLLDDQHGHLPVAPAHGVLQLHFIVVGAAAQVGVIHGHHVAAVDRRGAVLKALELVAHLGVAQRIVEHIAVNGQLLRGGRDRERAVFIGVNRPAVHLHKRYRRLEVIDILKGLLDVDLADAGGPGDVQVALLGQLAVGIGRGDAGQAVGDAVVDGVDFSIGDQFLDRRHVDAVA